MYTPFRAVTSHQIVNIGFPTFFTEWNFFPSESRKTHRMFSRFVSRQAVRQQKTIHTAAPRNYTNVRRGAGAVVLGAGYTKFVTHLTPSLFSWWSRSPSEPEDPNLFPKAYKPPSIEEVATLTFAPDVPPPLQRNHPVKLKVDMDVEVCEILFCTQTW